MREVWPGVPRKDMLALVAIHRDSIAYEVNRGDNMKVQTKYRLEINVLNTKNNREMGD